MSRSYTSSHFDPFISGARQLCFTYFFRNG